MYVCLCVGGERTSSSEEVDADFLPEKTEGDYQLFLGCTLLQTEQVSTSHLVING